MKQISSAVPLHAEDKARDGMASNDGASDADSRLYGKVAQPHKQRDLQRAGTTPIAKVVSACTRADLETWRHAARKITRCIPARSFVVLVPDGDVPLFQDASPAAYCVLPESTYAPAFEAALDQRTSDASRKRRGWYLQQLLKLCAVNDGEPDDVCVIWDGDTIPLRRLRFLDANNHLHHYCAAESHPPYFQMIDRLLGLSKAVPYSYVAQCLPMKVGWIHELRQHIEQRHGVDWLTAIIGAIDFFEASGLSEYETLGTFFHAHHQGDFCPHNRRWSRHGKLLVGTPGNLDRWWAKLVTAPFDYVSFEKWEPSFGGSFPSNVSYVLKTVAPKLENRLRRLAAYVRPNHDTRVRRFLRGYFSSSLPKYVVQVGANDGEQNDPLRAFLQTPGNYSALLVEPLPFYGRKLIALYHGRSDIQVLQAAVGQQRALQPLFFIDPDTADRMNGDGPPNNWAHGQGSFDRATVEHWIRANAFRGQSYVDAIPEYIRSIQSLDVPVVTLADCMGHSDNTLLCIDVQGRELDVLKGVDWSRPPRYVMFEDDLDDGALVARFLETQGYRYVCGQTDKVYALDATSRRALTWPAAQEWHQ